MVLKKAQYNIAETQNRQAGGEPWAYERGLTGGIFGTTRFGTKFHPNCRWWYKVIPFFIHVNNCVE